MTITNLKAVFGRTLPLIGLNTGTKDLLCSAGLLLLLFGYTTRSLGQTPANGFAAELRAARRQVIQTGEFKVAKLDLGAVIVGENTVTATVRTRRKTL